MQSPEILLVASAVFRTNDLPFLQKDCSTLLAGHVHVRKDAVVDCDLFSGCGNNISTFLQLQKTLNMQRRVLVSITFTFDGFDGDENFSFRILLVEVLCFGKASVIDAGETEGKDLVNRITWSTPELVQCKLLV